MLLPIPPRRLLRDPHYRRGAADMLPVAPGIAAWGVVTGVAMVQSGLGPWLSLAMSLLVFAGSSQLAALPLLAAGAPMWVVWATAFCVNVRFIVFSVNWRDHLMHLTRGQRLALAYFLADFNLAIFQKAWPDGERHEGQARYLAGGASIGWSSWQLASITGIALSSLVPLQWGLGFAGTLSILGLAFSLLGDRITWVAAGVSATAAVATWALPLKLNILVAIAAAVAAALAMRAALPDRPTAAPAA